MDTNQQFSKLDPKIKEAYDRVMSTPVSTPQPLPTDQPLQSTPSFNQNVASTPSSAPVQPTPTIVPGVSPTLSSRREPETVHIGSTPHANVGKNKNSSGSLIIYIIGGIVFLIVYTVFWLKFFNVPIPFLPF